MSVEKGKSIFAAITAVATFVFLMVSFGTGFIAPGVLPYLSGTISNLLVSGVAATMAFLITDAIKTDKSSTNGKKDCCGGSHSAEEHDSIVSKQIDNQNKPQQNNSPNTSLRNVNNNNHLDP